MAYSKHAIVELEVGLESLVLNLLTRHCCTVYQPTYTLLTSWINRRVQEYAILLDFENFVHARAKCARLSLLSGCDRKQRTPRKETGYEAMWPSTVTQSFARVL